VCFLHSLVSWAAGTFGDGPADIVKGTFSLTGFAVQAIRGVGRLDLVRRQASCGVDCLIYASRAKRNTRTAEFRRAFCAAKIRG